MYSRLAILLFFVMVACIGTRVGAQQTTPATGPMPSPPSELTPRPLPPPVPPPPPQLTPPNTPPPSTPPETSATAKLPLIAGLPYEDALAILKRHNEELINLPGADGVSLDPGGILVYTDNPAVVPAEVEGLPVITAPALGWKTGEIPSGPAEGTKPPPEQQCDPYARWDANVGRCFMPAPPPGSNLASPSLSLLSPPSGVTVLRPGGMREQADACPKGFKETVEPGGWRFCVDPEQPEPIPPLWVPPVAGIPFEEVEAVFWRHREELMKVPGVSSISLGADGIHVDTVNPAAIPLSVEGVPIKADFPQPVELMNHTLNTPVDPHGGVAIRDFRSGIALGGTLTSVALSKGKPWLVFPTHLMEDCEFDALPQLQCPPFSTSVLNDCPPYAGTERVVQPPAQTPVRTIGYVQRWDFLDKNATDPNGINPGIGTLHVSTDVAAAYMDNNTVAGDDSLKAKREMESCSSPSCLWSGAQRFPSMGMPVKIVSWIDPHILSATISRLNRTVFARSTCAKQLNGPDVYPPLDGQLEFTINPNPDGSTWCITNGDSGSAVLDAVTGDIVGMLNWAQVPTSGCAVVGGGTTAPTIKTTLGFDSWYGANTTDLSVQVYPAFRSEVAGQGACAWAYIKNTGTVTANSVAIQNDTTFSPQPAFNYQNPAGQWNIPYSIPAGQTATFAVCLTLNQPQNPILWLLNFFGPNAAAPVYKFAYNTLATRWSATATPDPAITTATLSNDDVVHTGGPNGTGAFSLTTVNNGASGAVTITLDTDDGDGQLLPYTLWVCETNTQAQCISSILPSLSVHLPASEPRYFTVLAQGQGQAVALDPYYNRIYFRIREGLNTPTGTLVGAAGLSITTT